MMIRSFHAFGTCSIALIGLIGLTAIALLSGCEAPAARAFPSTSLAVGEPSESVAANDETIVFSADRYSDAFDAAVEVIRTAGFEPEFMDRRSGRIETAARRSASVLEPWDGLVGGGGSLNASWENTLHYQRRMLRFEFRSTMFAPEDHSSAQSEIYGAVQPMRDLTTGHDPIEMQVTVIVQRQQAPTDVQAGWSLEARNESWLIDPATGQRRKAFWQPVRRDLALEWHLLQKVAEQLRKSENVPTS